MPTRTVIKNLLIALVAGWMVVVILSIPLFLLMVISGDWISGGAEQPTGFDSIFKYLAFGVYVISSIFVYKRLMKKEREKLKF
jgi:hypothetical protein